MTRFPLPRIVLLLLASLMAASCAELTNLPTLTKADLRFKLAESSRILAGDGAVITTLHEAQNRTIVPLSAIPKHVRNAVVAIEDERFYEHDGVDVRAIIRAAMANITSGEVREGGSTITQQYVKNVIISPNETAERTLKRKINEAALSRQLENELSKKQILWRYLNTVYFGAGAYGIQEAAQTFFGKSARDLKVQQGALLAGLIRSPQQYDPFDHPKVSRERRDIVLRKMAELGWVEETRLDKLLAKRLGVRSASSAARYPAAYFIDYVTRLIKWHPDFRFLGKTIEQREKQLFQGGLRIYTTVDLDMQQAAEQAVNSVLPNDSDPHGSLVAIDPDTGWVKAMVGGRDWFAQKKKDQYAKLNLAIQAEPNLGCIRPRGKKCDELRAAGTGRQGGSAFKPFALAAAINDGISLAETFKAAPCLDIPGADAGKTWHVCNYEESAFGQVSLLEGTISSINVVYAQLILKVGEAEVVDLAEDMGINTELEAVPSAVLGANAVNPLGMASAYGTLATGGVHNPPIAISKIEDARGRVVYRAQLEPQEVLNPVSAYLTTSALEQVIQRGTGTAAQIGRPAAGKTGTAQEYRDAWFVGYTPDLVASVWVGYPQGEIEMKTSCAGAEGACIPTRIQVTGGSWPAEIWQNFMSAALAGAPATSFDRPNTGIVTVTIDSKTGCVADQFTPPERRVEASFQAGLAPEETCRVKGDVARVTDVMGFPVDDAVRILEDDGFVVNIIEEETAQYPPNRVIAQNPAGGTRARTGTTVSITVSVPQGSGQGEETEVPDVLGQSRASAEQELSDAGFGVRVVYEKESDKDRARKRRGRVWKQDPAAGSDQPRGSTVTIWVNP
jgi:penicillin-binding protein 1A